jgi:cyclopropane-fatty-acyl-phospholipid synthase
MTTDPRGPVDIGEDALPPVRRWNRIGRVRRGPRTLIWSPIAAALFRRAVAQLPLRAEHPDGTVVGGAAGGDPPAPRMLIHRPTDFAAQVATEGRSRNPAAPG